MNSTIENVVRWIAVHYEEIMSEWTCIQCGACCRGAAGEIKIHRCDWKRWKGIIVKSNLGEFPMLNFISDEYLFSHPITQEEIPCPFLRKVRNEPKYYCRIHDPAIKPIACQEFQKHELRPECTHTRRILKRKLNLEFSSPQEERDYFRRLSKELVPLNRKHELNRKLRAVDTELEKGQHAWSLIYKGYLLSQGKDKTAVLQVYERLRSYDLHQLVADVEDRPPIELLFDYDPDETTQVEKILEEFLSTQPDFQPLLFRLGLFESISGNNWLATAFFLRLLEEDESYLEVIKNHDALEKFRAAENEFPDFFHQITFWRESGIPTYKEFRAQRKKELRKKLRGFIF